MQTTDPAKSRLKSGTRRWRLIAIAACIAFVPLSGLGVKLWLDHRVPSPDASAGRLSRYMSSPAFAALPDAQKAPYLEAFQHAIDRGELTPEEQRAVLSNVSSRNGMNPIQQYFSLSPGKEREKFLDDVIDRVAKADQERKRAASPNQKEEKELQIDGGRLADATPPQERAEMNQFQHDLRDRRQARGLPPDDRFLFARPD
jgi:hypothetical protein